MKVFRPPPLPVAPVVASPRSPCPKNATKSARPRRTTQNVRFLRREFLRFADLVAAKELAMRAQFSKRDSWRLRRIKQIIERILGENA